MMTSDEEKRWIVVGIALNRVVASSLRPFIKQGMDAHYNKLDNHCKVLSVPCTLKTLSHSQASKDAILKNLKFQNINNNRHLHGHNKKFYNFNVSSSVDLAKLYLPNHLTMFATFDESLDLSTMLRLLMVYHSSTAPIFPSPDPSLCIQTAAHDVKDGVRNMWGHCDITRWTETFFDDCFTKLEVLVKSLGLAGHVEKTTLDQLSDWKTKGRFLCMGHVGDQNLLSSVQQLVADLRKHFEKYSSRVRKTLAGQKRKFCEIQQAAASLQDQQRSRRESNVNEERQTEMTQLQKEEWSRILKRLDSLEKSLGREVTNKIRQLEKENVQGKRNLQELEKRQVQTEGKVQRLENDFRLKTLPDAHHVDDSILKTCRTKLAEHYKRTARVATSVWSSKAHVDIHDIYTRLTWMRKKHNASGPSQTSLEHYTDVFRETQTGVLPKRILVQGNAGIGKSTFVKKLAVDWAELDTSDQQTEALRKFELVVVVKLREISRCQSVREIIQCSRILPNDDPALTKCLLNFVVKNQEKVLFVLDGYDEYSGGRESVIFQIFQRDELRDCCVLITSRPSKAEDLQEFADVDAEITGFCEEDIFKFMRRMLGSEKEVYDLQSCLRKKEVLNTATTPLLLLFYCILWMKGKQNSFRGTRTELYLSMVQCLLDYGHRRRSAGSRLKVDDYKELLADLGKVALEALLKDDLVFEYDKLSEAVQCEASRVIGLLEVSEYAENITPAGQVSFIHKSIQEFLAAWYITHRCIPAGNLGAVKRSAQTFNECLVLENVLRFICGLSNDGAKKVFEHLKSVRISDPTVDLSKRIGLPDSGPQSRYEGTYKEERFNGFVYELFREAHLKEELLKHCFDCTEGIVLLSDLVCEYLGQLQRVTCVTDSGLFVLPRSRDVREPQVFPDCLNVPLSFNVTDSGNLKVRDFLIKFQNVRCEWCFFRSILWLRENSMKFYMTDVRLCCQSHASLICDIFAGRVSCVEFLREFECLVPLNENIMERLGEIVGESKYLSRIEVSGDNAICSFLNQLQNAAMRNCSLCFKWITLSSSGAETLASLLPRFKNIAAMRFGLRGCSGASCRSLIGGITHETLRELSMWTADLNPETALALRTSLAEMSKLEELSLVGDDKVVENGETDFLFGELKTDLPLRILEFSRYLVGNGIAPLSGALRFFPALQELYLHRVGICEPDIRILAERLKNTPNLEVISLSCNPLGRGVRYVMSALTILPNLRLLNLDQTDSSGEDMVYFQEVVVALPEPSLEHLNLSGNPLGPGVRAVMKLITKLPKLRALNLRNTGCSEKDMSFLCEAVNIEPRLNVEYLNFSSNPLGEDVRFVVSLISRLPKLCSLCLDDTGCSEEDLMSCIRQTPKILPQRSFRITGKTDSPPGDWLKGGVVIRI